MKKRIMVMVLVFSMLTGCGGQNSEQEGKVKMGYVINNLNDTFQTFILQTAQDYAEENNIELLVENSQEDTIKQQDVVNSLIQKGVKGLIVVPTDTSAMTPITNAAKEAEIPLVYVNRNPFANQENNIPENVYYVGVDEKSAGVMQMEYIGEQLGGKGGVAILMGILGNEGTLKRTEGVKEEMEQNFSNMQLLASETANWQRDQGLALTENFLTTYGDKLNAVIANNDEMALGAIQALKTSGKLGDVKVVGIDAITDALNSIEAGELSATVFQDPTQGRAAMEILDKLSKGETQEEQVKYIPVKLVTKDNYQDFK